MSRTILVTGGSGFIGTNYIHFLLNQESEVSVINLDDLTYAGNSANHQIYEEDERYKFVKGNICDPVLVNSLVCEADIIVNFAAESHVDRSINNPSVFIQTNVLGTHVLLDAALKNGKKRFHHISTDEVFGSLKLNCEDLFSESTPYDPRSPYSSSKAASDHLVRAYFHTYGLPITISNCSNNYGAYQHKEKFIPLFITNLMQNKKIPLYGTGINVRDWLHVNDHIKAIQLIINKGRIGETYCVGGGSPLSNMEVTELLLQEFGFGNEMIEYVEDRKGHDLRYSVDYSKIAKELGWRPNHTFIDGLRSTIDWYKTNEAWWSDLKT